MSEELARLLAFNAYRLYLAAPDCAVWQFVISPRVGDLVVEISTIYDRDRDPYRLGRLLRDCREPRQTEPIPEALVSVPDDWTKDQIAGFQRYWDAMPRGIPTERVFYIDRLDGGGEYRWHNAHIIRVFETPGELIAEQATPPAAGDEVKR